MDIPKNYPIKAPLFPKGISVPTPFPSPAWAAVGRLGQPSAMEKTMAVSGLSSGVPLSPKLELSTYSSHLKGENYGKLELLKNAFGSFGGSFEASDGFRHIAVTVAVPLEIPGVGQTQGR